MARAAALVLAAATHAPLMAQATAAASSAAEQAECAATRKQDYGTLAQRHETELRRHALHPVLVARLKGMGATLASLRTATARKPRNAAECEKSALALADAQAQLDRIAGSAAQLDTCLAANRALYGQTQASLLGLQTGDSAATPSLVAAAGRLDRLRAAVARDDVAFVDCRQLAEELAAAQAQVQGLLPPPPPPPPPAPAVAAAPAPAPASAPSAAACREVQARSYNALAQAYARLVGGGPVPVEWMAPLQALSGRLKQLHATIADANAPGWDCEAVARALARESSELATMSRR